MATNLTSRRRLLSLGLLTVAGAALPASAFAAPDDPAWLTGLASQLTRQSTWLRTERGAKGAVAFHCGMRDAAAWAGSFSKLAAKDVRVLAAGNILSFSRGGRAVRVVMHPVAA